MSSESDTPWTEQELAEIEALRTAAEKLLSRRRLLRRAALTLAWSTPLMEALVIEPEEAGAQGMKKDMGMTKKPMMVMLLGPGAA